jgi:hypothetical protein
LKNTTKKPTERNDYPPPPYKINRQMTPEYKAEILVDKFVKYTPADSELEYPYAKECAILAVNEIINEIYEIDNQLSESRLLDKNLKYWLEVKKELEKL